MITGFQAVMSVNDGVASADTKFNGITTFSLPELEAGKFDGTELAQDTGGESPEPDPFEREFPTGLIKVGATQAEMKYTKANYNRLVALCGAKSKVYKLTSPDDQTSGTATKLTVTFPGFVSKVGAVKFEKGNPVSIPFEITCQSKPTYS